MVDCACANFPASLGQVTFGAGVSAAGNVEIGMPSAPQSRLTVRSVDDTSTTNIIETLANNQTIGIALGYDAIRMGGSAANSDLRISAKGTGHLLLQPVGSGNVGIGTTAPGSRLTIDGPQGTAIHVLNSDIMRGVSLAANGASGNGVASLNTTSAGYALTFGIDSNEKMRIATNGHVAIGRGTAPAPLSVDALQAGNTRSAIKLRAIGSRVPEVDLGFEHVESGPQEAFSIQTNPFGGVAPPIALAPTIGNVGIGTSTPTAKLDVRGAPGTGFLFQLADIDANPRLKFDIFTLEGTTPVFRIIPDDSPYLVLAPTLGNIGIRTGAVVPKAPLHVGAATLIDGNVGIGTGALPSPVAGYTSVAIDGTTGGLLEIRGAGAQKGVFFYDGALARLRSGAGTPLVFDVGGGTERMRITEAGNVGIGTTTPASKLTVDGPQGTAITVLNSDTFRGVRLAADSAAGVGSLTTTSGAYALTLGADNQEAMRIVSTGNVGIGTAPEARLHVRGTASAPVFRLSNADGTRRLTVDFLPDGSAVSLQPAADALTPHLALAPILGSVGIGTVAPAGKLDVQGGEAIFGMPNQTFGISLREFTGGTARQVLGFNAANVQVIGTYNNSAILQAFSLDVRTGSPQGSRMTVTSGGDVGIGRPDPQAKLHVNGNLVSDGQVAIAGLVKPGSMLFVKGPTSGNGYAAELDGDLQVTGIINIGNRKIADSAGCYYA